jgi:hypothetical protein
MFLLALLKTFTNSKNCSESRIKVSVPGFLCFHWSISLMYMVGFRVTVKQKCYKRKSGLASFNQILKMLIQQNGANMKTETNLLLQHILMLDV